MQEGKVKQIKKLHVQQRRQRLFGRFYTVENARHSTGLGLSIAKTFVERMNGEIRAEYHDSRLFIIIKF